MAAILKTDDRKIPYIYNISQKVGFLEPNMPDDVQLIQVLFAEIAPCLGIGKMKPHPTVNGVFDTVTGYWVFQLQKMLQSKMDGKVSPVTGTDAYTGGKMWTLWGLNEILYWNLPHKFENLHEDSRLSPSLRSSIKH